MIILGMFLPSSLLEKNQIGHIKWKLVPLEQETCFRSLEFMFFLHKELKLSNTEALMVYSSMSFVLLILYA